MWPRWTGTPKIQLSKKRKSLTTTSPHRSHFIYPGLFLTLMGLCDDMHGILITSLEIIIECLSYSWSMNLVIHLQPTVASVSEGQCRGGPTLSDLIYINMWSWLSANQHSFVSWRIFGHQKLLTWWVHYGWGVFSTILELSIRSRSITAVHLALKSHMNAVWRSKRHAMLLLTGVTLSASRNLP